MAMRSRSRIPIFGLLNAHMAVAKLRGSVMSLCDGDSQTYSSADRDDRIQSITRGSRVVVGGRKYQ